MTAAEFDALLAMLDPDREVAGQSYERIRNRLIRMFEWRRCAHPEDLADETFNRVARKSAEGLAIKHSDPYAYFCGVAHHVFQEFARREQRENRVRESGDWPPSSPPEEEEPDLRLEHLRHCLDTLDPDQKNLILLYYQPEQRILSRKILCDKLGIPMNALRIRVHRLRKRVEACVEEKLLGLSMKRFPASGHIKTEARQGDDFSRTRDHERP
jgi:RNA polymerase sigma-70 factor, ECF subfamily